MSGKRSGDNNKGSNRPQWGVAKRDESGRVVITCYTPPKAVWQVCGRYLLKPFTAPNAKTSWRTDVAFAFQIFMNAEYCGPGDDEEKARVTGRVIAAAKEFRNALECVPEEWVEPPSSLVDAELTIFEVVDEIIEDYEFARSSVLRERNRGAPSRKHVGVLAKTLSATYRTNKKDLMPESPAEFLADIEKAFGKDEGAVIGFSRRTTRGFSFGARIVRSVRNKS